METQAQNTKGSDELEGKYLTFRLGREEFGVQILKVREIIAMQEITPLPTLPEAVRGVINLRGRIIPVVDLRLQLEMHAKDYDRNTCIIVQEVEIGSEGELLPIGCVVDAVSEVLSVSSAIIEGPPSFGGNVDVSYLLGIAKLSERSKVVSLLDIDSVLSSVASQAKDLEEEEVQAA